MKCVIHDPTNYSSDPQCSCNVCGGIICRCNAKCTCAQDRAAEALRLELRRHEVRDRAIFSAIQLLRRQGFSITAISRGAKGYVKRRRIRTSVKLGG